MRIVRLAELLVLKHKLAISPAELEAQLRKKISVLWIYPNKNFNILRACADSGAAKPKDANERKAVAGHLFCKELVSIIDYLKVNAASLSLGAIREALTHIIRLIEKNKDIKFGPNGKPTEEGESEGIQFPHVSELIFQLIQVNRKHDVKLRNEQFGKAKTGLSRILSVALDMMDDVHKLEVMVPEKFKYENVTDIDTDQSLPDRFKPQRAPISENDIVDFIRQHGDDYGISSQEDWGHVFRDDPEAKGQMTTVINTINRTPKDAQGRPIWNPKDAADVKMLIADVLQRVEQRKSTNAPLFEDSE
jgi:hypothetical protein